MDYSRAILTGKMSKLFLNQARHTNPFTTCLISTAFCAAARHSGSRQLFHYVNVGSVVEEQDMITDVSLASEA